MHLILIIHLLHLLVQRIVVWFWLLLGTMRLSNMHPYSYLKSLEVNSVEWVGQNTAKDCVVFRVDHVRLILIVVRRPRVHLTLVLLWTWW